jgi:glycosyltransferase involved in cell wall biosynthesis
MHTDAMSGLKVAFLGSARYPQPLDPTSGKKFQLLAELGAIHVIGFGQDCRLRRFDDYVCFCLLPDLPWPIMRYIEIFVFGPLLALSLIFRRGVNILVAQGPCEGAAAALAKTIARSFGRKVALVVESHGDFEVSLFLQRRIVFPSLYRFLMHRAARFTLNHADVLRAVSDSTREQLERWVPGKPLVQFPTWTDIEVFLESGGRVEKQPQTINYVGVLIPRKGIHFLFEAFAQLSAKFPEARLWLIGKPENGDYARALRAQAEKMGFNGRVGFLDHLPQRELARHMAQAQALVFPTLSEGLPRVVMEAMAAGTPVIASAVSGIPEVVDHGKTGFLVPPGDIQALAERIDWVFTHPEEARQMGQRARAAAQEFFAPHIYRQGYRRLLQLAEACLRDTSS